MRSHRGRFLLLFVVLLLASPSGATPVGEGRKKLVDRMGSYLERCSLHGWSGTVLVAKGGKILLEAGYGLADRERGRECSAETLFEIASASKQVTAAAILKLEEMGKLSTHDAISRHLPGVPEGMEDVTIYHLLTHTSGMPRSAVGGRGDDLQTAVTAYLAPGRVRAPGEGYEYWNGGYALLAGVVETSSGKSYIDFCVQHLFKPAGLKHSGFCGEPRLERFPQATGYDGDEILRPASGHPYGSYGWQYRGMGGVVTSVRDLHRWILALQDDTVLGPEAREKLFRPFLSDYACGWYVTKTSRNTTRYSHGGDVKGFHTQIAFVPEEEIVVITFGNVEGVPMWAIAGNLESMVMGEKLRYPVPPEQARLKRSDLRALEGTYRLESLESGGRLVLRLDGDRVRVGAEGQLVVDILRRGGRRPVDPGHTATSIDFARAWVTELASGEAKKLRERLAPGIPLSWIDTLIRRIWAEHVKTWGRLRAVRVLSCEEQRSGYQRVCLRLEHARGETSCQVGLRDGLLARFELKGPEFGASAIYVPVSRDLLERHAWSGAPHPALRVEWNRRQVQAVTLFLPGEARAYRFERH